MSVRAVQTSKYFVWTFVCSFLYSSLMCLILYLTNWFAMFIFAESCFKIVEMLSLDGSVSFEAKNLLYRYLPHEKKRFECVTCGHRFTQKSTVTRHTRYFCGRGYRYQCPYCEVRASCSSNIYRHVRARHVGREARVIKLFSTINPRTWFWTK